MGSVSRLTRGLWGRCRSWICLPLALALELSLALKLSLALELVPALALKPPSKLPLTPEQVLDPGSGPGGAGHRSGGERPAGASSGARACWAAGAGAALIPQLA